MAFENIRADLRAYDGRWDAQGYWAMLVYRFGRWRYSVRPGLLRKLLSSVYHVPSDSIAIGVPAVVRPRQPATPPVRVGELDAALR